MAMMEEAWGDEGVDEADAEGEVEARGRSGPCLALNKLSSKIGKGSRKPGVQPKPIPPKIYNTDPTSFRNLVQELTGTASSPPAPSPRPPANTRLQKIAPPPLKTLPFPFPFSQQSSPNPNPNPFNPSSSFPKILSPIPILSPHTFSPLPGMASSEGMWPNPIDSPDTVALRRLAEKMVQNENASPNVSANPDAGSSFPWSPARHSFFGHASPGTSPINVFANNIYTGMGVNDSPSSKDFSFPEPDYVSGFS